MALLSFKVQADYDKVVRLREEITKLEAQLKSFGKNTPQIEIKAVESRLSEAKKEFTAVATEAAKAGAVMNSDFKNKIRESSKVVNSLSAQIIEQKSVIREHERDVKRLGEAYRNALKVDSSSVASIKEELDAAKRIVEKEKDALFKLTQEKAKASLATKKLKDEYADLKDEAKETSKESDKMGLSLGKIAGLVGGIAALKQLGSAIVQVRGQFQDMETQIETLVGKDTTAKIMPQIREMAKVSPLTMTDIVGAEKMMLSFNIEAEKSIDYLKALSDVSMGNSQKFNSLTLAFSQMSSAGRLMGQDLLQMINAGFNPLQIISQKTGKSIAQLKEEMSKGAISAEMVQQAFIDATSAGGKFYNMSENASKTINGQISMLQDAMDSVFNEIGTKAEGLIIKGIQAATTLIQNYEKIGKVLVGLVTTYGTYRTAVLLATSATSKHTLAEVALINVRIAARKAQIALNKAMLTNPYVAVASVVAGLTAAMWSLRDSTTAAEKAQKHFDEYKEGLVEKEKKHKDEIKGLIDAVRDETKAEGERIQALDKLKVAYKGIFSDYDIEALKLANIEDVLKRVNEEYSKKQNLSKKDTLSKIDAEIAQQEKDVELLGKKSSISVSQYVREVEYLNELRAHREKLIAEIRKDNVASFIASLADKSEKQIREEIKKLESAEYEFYGEKIDAQTRAEMRKGAEETISSRKSGPKYGESYKSAEKEWNEAKKALEKIEKDKDKFTVKQYEAAKSRKETAEQNFKKLGGDTTGKEEKKETKLENEQLAQQEKLKALTDKNARERARAAKDNEFMIEQARIDAMKDGVFKTMAQRRLDHQKEMDNLERQKQDYVAKAVEQEKAVFDAKEEAAAKNDPKYKKQTFDSAAAAAKVDTSAFDAAISIKSQSYQKAEGELAVGLYNQYKSYEDKKKELEKQYLDDTLVLTFEFLRTGDEKYKRSLDERGKAHAKAMNALEREFNTEDYKLIFGDPSKMTAQTIEKALSAARKKMAELDKEADPETFKALSEAINSLEHARDNNPFAGWDDSVMGIVQKLHQIKNINKDITQYQQEGNKEAEENSKAQLEKSQIDLRKSLAATGVSAFGETLSMAASSMREVAEASGDIRLAEQAEALEKASGFVSSIASGFASGGPIGAAIGAATSLIDLLVSSITKSEVVAANAKKAYNDYVNELASNARNINDADYETIFGVRALDKVQDASKKAVEAMRQYENVRDKALGGGYKVSNKAAIIEKGLGEQLVWAGVKQTAANAYKVPTLKEMFPDLFDDNGDIVMEQAQAILSAYSQYASEGWYKYLQAATESLQDYEANLAEVDSYISSLFSNLGSEIVDAIMQGDDALEALQKSAGNIFASISKQMITEMLMSQDFIDKYKERWRAAMASTEITDDASVIESMTDELTTNIEDAKALWEAIQKIAAERGIVMDGINEDLKQDATKKGYQTLSEDTGNELVGRATAQYESNLRMESAVIATKEIVDIMAAGQLQIKDIAAESRALIADSYLELQQIRENTGAVVKPIKNLSEKIDKWDEKIMSL